MNIAYDTALIIVPVLCAGIIHAWVIATDAMPYFKIPLDAGTMFRGRRIFGENKTLRGLIIMVLATGAIAGTLYTILPLSWEGSLPHFRRLWYSYVFGAILGFGYVFGELPNSFIKRQMDIPPGHHVIGAHKNIWAIIDQADSVIGICILLSALYKLPVSLLIAIFISGTAVHILFDRMLYRTGVKKLLN